MKLAIVGIFYDGYIDMWEDFLILFRKNWPECPYELFIVNQSADVEFAEKYGVTIIHAGDDAEFSRKMYVALRDIEADYYMFLLEDFFVGEKLKKNALEKSLQFVEQNKVKYLDFYMPLFFKKNSKHILNKMEATDEYTIVSSYQICEREFMKKCVGSENYNAWVFEGIYAKAPKAHTAEFLEGCYRTDENPLELYHGAVQGKMLPQTKKYFEKTGYTFHTNREELDQKACRCHGMKIMAIKILPRNIRYKLRKVFHGSSVLGKWDSEIQKYIRLMGLE